MKWLFMVFGGLAAVSTFAHAETLSFPKAWRQVDGGSKAQESARLAAQSAAEAGARAGRHWLPRFYLDARAYQTNDPAASFMGALEQRSLQATDFAPDTLNHPTARIYSRAAIGMDLPLFQGGAGVAQVKLVGASASAKVEESEQVRAEQYAETARAYASVAALERGLSRLREMQGNAEKLHRGYQLGSKSNPVGYSGALGMKALAQRLEALVKQYLAQKEALLAELRELGVAQSNWQPEGLPAVDFASRYFKIAAAEAGGSHRLEALRHSADMGVQAVAMERSKFLPQVGIFTEGYGFDGNRKTATGYSAGLYLRWSLFNPSDYGAVGEAKLRAASAERYAEASQQEERAAIAGMEANLAALRNNIGLLTSTEDLLREQAKVTETLFKNGSINALQFVEVINRRADLTVQQIEADLAFLQLSAQAFGKQKTDISLLAEK